MTPAVSLRSVGPSDEPFLFHLFAATRSDITTLQLPEQEKLYLMRMQYTAQRRHYDTHFPSADRSIILAEGLPAGRLYVNRSPEEHRVIDLSLVPEYRGLGIGTRLLEEILDGARAAGAPVRLHVEHFSRVRRLYDRLGFVPLSETDSHCLMEWVPPKGIVLPGDGRR